jgi:gas vesicle protein
MFGALRATVEPMTSRDYSCFFYGFGAGLGVAMLFAPKPGTQLRGELLGKMNEGRRKVDERTESIHKTVAREKAGVKAAVEAGKQAYKEATGRA